MAIGDFVLCVPGMKFCSSKFFLTLWATAGLGGFLSPSGSLVFAKDEHIKFARRLIVADGEILKFSRINDIPSQCIEGVDRVEGMAEEYFSSRGKMGIEGIQSFLTELEKNAVCFDFVSAALIFSSLTHLELRDWMPPEVSPNPAILANLFFLAGKLVVLTPKRREEMGGIWNLKSDGNLFKVQGAYNCSDSKIYIDVFQPLYNLGASMFHEEDHFFRDKFSQEVTKNLDAKVSLLLDETLAAVGAGYYQILRSVVLEGSVVNGDLSMFRDVGPLYTLWLWSLSMQRVQNRKGLWSPLSVIRPIFLGAPGKWLTNIPPVLRELLPQDRAEIETLRAEIYQLVSTEYFGSALTDVELAQLDPFNLSVDLDPFYLWMYQSRKDDFFRGVGATRDVKFHLDLMRRKSKACGQFESQIKSGNLNGYLLPLAVKPIKPGSGGIRPSKPIKPGSGGIRPSESTLKLCLDLRKGL